MYKGYGKRSSKESNSLKKYHIYESVQRPKEREANKQESDSTMRRM